MTAKIVLSLAARADLDDIHDFIAADNDRAAEQVVRRLANAISLLADQPLLGRAFRHGRHRLRLMVQAQFLVFHRVARGRVEIIRIMHGRRHVPDILDEL